MLLIGISHYLSLGRVEGYQGWFPSLKGERRGGEKGSGVTNKVQREDWKMSDKPLRNLSTQNDYVASRVQAQDQQNSNPLYIYT